MKQSGFYDPWPGGIIVPMLLPGVSFMVSGPLFCVVRVMDPNEVNVGVSYDFLQGLRVSVSVVIVAVTCRFCTVSD